MQAPPQVFQAHAAHTSPASRIVLRPVATPLPLAFLAQAVACMGMAGLELHWIGAGQAHQVAWSILVLTVPLQVVAAVVGYLSRDPVAGTGTGLLAGGWAATAVVTLTAAGSTRAGLGIVLISVGCALLVPVVAGRSKLAAAAVMLLGAARFAANGVHELTAAAAWQTTAGWLAVALGAVGAYAALAFELESTAGRTVLPIGRNGLGSVPLNGDASAQLRGVEHEAGVRRVL